MSLQSRVERIERERSEGLGLCAHGWELRDSTGAAAAEEKIKGFTEEARMCDLCGLPKRIYELVDAEDTTGESISEDLRRRE